MSTGELLRVLFYFSGIISIVFGAYILYLNPKDKLNGTFFALCMSLGIWAMAFSMAISASDAAACLLWRRVSAIGWGSMYGILLHFCLAFSKKDRLLRKWWLYILIYGPALVTVYVFGISKSLSVQQYNFVRTAAGWTNVSVNNAWDWFFNIYYVSFMLCGLMTAWIYGRRTNSGTIKKQVKLLVWSFLVAFLLGSATDIAGNSLFAVQLPQIAPIIILLPVMTIFYSLNRYGMMNPRYIAASEIILTKTSQDKVYSNLSWALLVGGVVSYFVQYLYYGDFLRPLYSSAFILVLGIFVSILKATRIDGNMKDIFLVSIIFAAIPSITLIFIKYGSVTVWSVSFLFIVIAMIFNRPIVLFSISVSIISTQILIWILRPSVAIAIDQVDYVGRIGILCITIGFAYYVNKIYIRRLKQNSDQLSHQKFISEISSDFINVNQSNIEEKMNWVIRIVGKLFSIDRITMLQVDIERCDATCTDIWNYNQRHKGHQEACGIVYEDVAWVIEQLMSSESVNITDVACLPETAAGFRKRLLEERVQSLVAIPIADKDHSMTILQFISVTAGRICNDEVLRVLHIISNLFNDALLKVEAEKEVSFMAYHDHLTGLPNRRLFRDRINQAIALAKRTEKKLGIIFIDLDSFKTINDTIGHEGGDALLKIVSDKLVKAVRESDTVSRFGGDEFLVMVNNLADEDAIAGIAEKIINVLSEPFYVEGQEFYLTTSLGIALYPFDGTDMDSLLKNADSAMYKAKENGKNQYVVCSSELKNEVIEKIRITNSLYRALERGEFYLNYQPQIQVSTGKIIGLEALIRWRHHELGLVSPVVFIPIAEQIGVIGEIGAWVLRQACLQNKEWQLAGYDCVCMAVNVSAYQLRNKRFADQVGQTIRETGLEPGFIEIEITESAAMNETRDVIGLMNILRSLGISIAIDDFGTDYSSLSRLKELPIDKIKIDKRFIDGIGNGEKDRAIVRTIIDLSRNLELKIIAEGVEDKNQLEFLKQNNCNEVQGYYYYKPMPASEVTHLLQQQTQ